MFKIYVWNSFMCKYVGASGLVTKKVKDLLLDAAVKYYTNPIIAIPFFGYHKLE